MTTPHLLVVGSGIAGLYATLLAAEAGAHVTLLSKGQLRDSNTYEAQGGICAVLAPAATGDTVESHIADTLSAGAGQCDDAAVHALCSEAAQDIAALENFGIVFDVDAAGQRALGLEGAHSAPRILHAAGDATGAAIAGGLIQAVRQAAAGGLVTLREHCFVTELLHATQPDSSENYAADHGENMPDAVVGAGYLDALDQPHTVFADAVLLATGGAGQLFSSTTNPSVATGDGVALAWRAGAAVGDLEYFQFHPTALAHDKHFLISEAVRGAGAVLRDASGERFMPQYHPDAELAPRDVVSRSIAAHLAVSASTMDASSVFLDATGLEKIHGAGYLAGRFPSIDAATSALGFDWRQQWLPVVPAAHYWMGGVVTDLQARTSVPGLYAAGEVACTGVHGANRLASNSLLEGLVFSRRAVAAFMRGTAQWPLHSPEARKWRPDLGNSPLVPRPQLQRIMNTFAGVSRTRSGLQQAVALLRENREYERQHPVSLREQSEDANLVLLAHLLLQAALVREESCGTHYRQDFPDPPLTGQRDAAVWQLSHPVLSAAHCCMTPHQLRESESV